jgi:hypothetical protein
MARIKTEPVATDHLDPAPPEATLPAESVPTTLAVGPDGLYVGELKGFPFRPGSSNIYKVSFNANNAVCDPSAVMRHCGVAYRGFTAIQDIDVNQRTRNLYVYGLGAGGVLPFEEGFSTGVFPPAQLVKVTPANVRTELAPGALKEPGGVRTTLDGRVFVTDNIFTPDGGRLLRVEG